MIKVVVACDSFKGSLTAAEATASVAVGVRSALGNRGQVVEIPVADGGEGTSSIITRAAGGEMVRCLAPDSLGRKVECAYGIVERVGNAPLAVIELAEASGLTRLKTYERNPLLTSTRGTGEMIADAYARGCRSFIVGLGGSATNDGGAGLLQALGVRLLGRGGEEIADGGGALEQLEAIDMSHARRDILNCRFTVLCDVTNPLVGPDGAAAVFGPQKGASPADVVKLDKGLRRYADIVMRTVGIDVATFPGAGAAGGVGAAFKAFFDAETQSGIHATLSLCGFGEHVADASLVITGEGKIDLQTLGGKAPAGVLEVARHYGVPVVALAGAVSDMAELRAAGFADVVAVSPQGVPLSEVMRSDVASANLRNAAVRVIDRLFGAKSE